MLEFFWNRKSIEYFISNRDFMAILNWIYQVDWNETTFNNINIAKFYLNRPLANAIGSQRTVLLKHNIASAWPEHCLYTVVQCKSSKINYLQLLISNLQITLSNKYFGKQLLKDSGIYSAKTTQLVLSMKLFP